MSLTEDLVIPQGKTWIGPIWALLNDLGGPYDLTGKTIRGQARPAARESPVLYEWSTTAGNIVVTDVTVEVDGVPVETVAVALKVAPAVSSAWAWQSGVYDIEITDGTDTWPLIDPSTVLVTAEVTR